LFGEAIHHVEGCGAVFTQVGRIVRLVQLAPMVQGQNGVDEQASLNGVLLVDQLGRLVAVPPEAAGNQHEKARPEQEATLALQARFAQYALERAIRHALQRSNAATALHPVYPAYCTGGHRRLPRAIRAGPTGGSGSSTPTDRAGFCRQRSSNGMQW